MRAILGLVLIWIVLAGLAALTLLPHLPASSGQWVALIVLGPPAYVFFELVGSAIFSEDRSNRISKRSFSLARIGFGLLVAIPLLAVVWALGWLFHRLA